jgi:predicted transcriptional regulator
MEEFQLKLLAFMSDDGPHYTEEFIEHVGEESEIESALENLIAQGHVTLGEHGSYSITEEGMDIFNEQLERD